jgi:hypothetical protein
MDKRWVVIVEAPRGTYDDPTIVTGFASEEAASAALPRIARVYEVDTDDMLSVVQSVSAAEIL